MSKELSPEILPVITDYNFNLTEHWTSKPIVQVISYRGQESFQLAG